MINSLRKKVDLIRPVYIGDEIRDVSYETPISYPIEHTNLIGNLENQSEA